MFSARGRAIRLALLCLFFIPFLVLVPLPVARAAPRGFTWPVHGSVLRGFEKPRGPYGEGGHQGLDISASQGETVRAAQDGTVDWIGELPRGRFITLTHAGGVRSTYLDLETISVLKGQRVERGQEIATVAGHSDGSSAATHLHFDTYLNGSPVDPRMLLGGIDTSSFIRLCPVDRGKGSTPGAGVAPGVEGGRWSGPVVSRTQTSGPGPPAPTGFWGQLKNGLSAAWGGVKACGGWVARGCARAGVAIARFARWAWSNNYVQAVFAGFAAALVVVAGVILAFILLPISAIVAAIAGFVGALACIGMAIYYAVTSGSGFTFAGCFFRSLAAGGIAATAAISCGALSSTFAAGWADVGLTGMLKAAFWNGVFATMFDSGTNLLFTGHFSLKRALISFGVGMLSGAFGKVLRTGMFTERITGFLTLSESGAEAGALGFSQSVSSMLSDATLRLQGLLLACKELALTSGGKLAYVAFSGSLASGLNAVTCLAMHRPITLSGMLASFVAGAAMGGIALTFGGLGLNGPLSRFAALREGLGATFRRFAVKIANKSMQRSLKNAFEASLKKLLHEEEVQQ